MSLWKSKKFLAQAISVTSHGDHHSMVENYPDMQFLIGLILESLISQLQPDWRSEIKEFKDLFAVGSPIIGGRISINWYKNRAWNNWNTTNIVDFGNDLYDLDEEELAAIEEHTRLLDIEEKDDNKL